MKRMHGFIDPISLGFLIAIVGGTAAYITHKDNNNLPDKSNNNIESSTSKGNSPAVMNQITPEG